MSAGDTTIVRLPTSEYAHLQALRQAVVDEEKRLAVQYGAYMALTAVSRHYLIACDRIGGCIRYSDHYEYHGQCLLIQKSDKESK